MYYKTCESCKQALPQVNYALINCDTGDITYTSTDLSAYEMIREENFDPANPHKVRFRRDYTALSTMTHVAVNKETGEEYDNYEIAHFRLLTDTNFLPYGRSLLEPAGAFCGTEITAWIVGLKKSSSTNSGWLAAR